MDEWITKFWWFRKIGESPFQFRFSVFSFRENKFLDRLNHSDGRYIDATLPPGIVKDKNILIAVLSTTLEPIEEAPHLVVLKEIWFLSAFKILWKITFWALIEVLGERSGTEHCFVNPRVYKNREGPQRLSATVSTTIPTSSVKQNLAVSSSINLGGYTSIARIRAKARGSYV